jgi:FlaA1/EpsC-like NDP-sugar epimerase
VTRLLITGAGGNIGSVYARHAAEHGRYERSPPTSAISKP